MDSTSTGLGVPVGPWEIAKARFMTDLTDSEKAIFQKASLENLFYASSVACKDYDANSKLPKFSKKLQPMIECIDAYGKALDVFSNASPIFLCPIWGSIRVVLHIAQKYRTSLDNLLEMFAQIGDALPRFREYEMLFPGHERLRQALCNAYLIILEFCIDAKSVFVDARKKPIGRVTFKGVWKTFTKDFDRTYLAKFRSYQSILEKEAGLCHMVEWKQAQALQEQEKKAKKRRKLLALLSGIDYVGQHGKLQKLRHHGTGTWLAEVQAFSHWQESQVSGCLGCFGIPGSGKTVLASSVVDSMSSSYLEVGSAICYYYCHYANTSTLDISSLVGTITRQLLERIEIPEDVAEDINRLFRQGSTNPLPEDLINLFIKVLSHFSRAMIIIDGIDELAKHGQTVVLEALRRLMQLQDTTVKAMIFSRREEKLIRQAFKDDNSIDILVELVRDDIARYVSDSVDLKLKNDELKIRDPGLRQVIIDTLVDGAKDMFLWVKFQLEEICEAITDDAIRETLQNLPKDIAETFARILKRICTSTGSEVKITIMRKIFPWLACAKRPLTIEELNEAYAIDAVDQYLNRSKIPTDYMRILWACGSLIIFDRDDRTVTFAHHTVKQFLLSSTYSSPFVDPIRFTLREADFNIGEACVTYLCFSDFETQILKKESTKVSVKSELTQGLVWSHIPFGNALSRFVSTIHGSINHRTPNLVSFDVPVLGPPSEDLERAYHLLKYVALNWHYHTSQFTPTKETSWAKFRYLTFERQLSFNAQPWTASNWRLPSAEPILPHINLFRWAVDQNLVAFLNLLLELVSSGDYEDMLAYINYELVNGRDPLKIACQKGSAASLRFLLDQGLQNVQDSSLMLEAAKEGHEDVVRLLLERMDAYPDSKDNKGRTPLSWAAGNGHELVVKLLIEQSNINVNSRDYMSGHTPLTWAAKNGHVEVVKILAERGDVELDPKDNEGWTPLSWAATIGHKAVVQLLVERGGINANSRDSTGRTPLSWAAGNGHKSVVEFLVGRTDVDTNSKDNASQTPLSWAVKEGNEAVVRVLSGAN